MASIVPSSALLNTRLTSEKLALEEQLRAIRGEILELSTKNRDLEQRNASLSDEVERKDRALCELRAHVLRLLGTGAKRQTLPPGQHLLFADATSDTVATAIEDLASPDEDIEVVELDASDVEIPDAEEPEKEAPGRRKPRDRKARKLDESNLRREVRRSELPGPAAARWSPMSACPYRGWPRRSKPAVPTSRRMTSTGRFSAMWATATSTPS